MGPKSDLKGALVSPIMSWFSPSKDLINTRCNGCNFFVFFLFA